jgi:hypothetical protein
MAIFQFLDVVPLLIVMSSKEIYFLKEKCKGVLLYEQYYNGIMPELSKKMMKIC